MKRSLMKPRFRLRSSIDAELKNQIAELQKQVTAKENDYKALQKTHQKTAEN